MSIKIVPTTSDRYQGRIYSKKSRNPTVALIIGHPPSLRERRAENTIKKEQSTEVFSRLTEAMSVRY